MSCLACFASCCLTMTCGLCTSVASGVSRKSARLAYCGLLGLSLIVSWILREVGAPLLEKLPWINTSDPHSKEWFQIQAVLRVSLGNFLFFAIFALIMIGVKDHDRRDSWHHGTISKFGAGLFLLVQVVNLLDFLHAWNDAWVAKDEQKWYIALLVISIVCYLGAFAFSGVLFIWFNPSGHDCGLNIFFIVMTMILAFGFAIIALHPTLFQCTVLMFAIRVSLVNHVTVCNGLHNKTKSVSTSTLILGMFTTILSILYSAVRAGSSTTFLSPPSSPKAAAAKKPLLEEEQMEEGKEKKETEARPVSYSYTFFHLIFALASMHVAMLLSGWTNSTESSQLIDVGWTSVWVRICTEWVTAALYVWTLIAPILVPDREFF